MESIFIHTLDSAQAENSKSTLIRETRALVASVDNTNRQIADNLAALRDQHRMSQAEIGKAMNKSQAWVSALLTWRAAGFPDDAPFAAGSKAARDQRNARVRKARANYQATDNRPTVRLSNGETLRPDDLSEAAQRQIAAGAGNDVDPAASADERKAVYSGTKQPKKDGADWFYNEAVYFDAHTMAKMDDMTFTRVMKMFNDNRAERQQRKAAA